MSPFVNNQFRLAHDWTYCSPQMLSELVQSPENRDRIEDELTTNGIPWNIDIQPILVSDPL